MNDGCDWFTTSPPHVGLCCRQFHQSDDVAACLKPQVSHNSLPQQLSYNFFLHICLRQLVPKTFVTSCLTRFLTIYPIHNSFLLFALPQSILPDLAFPQYTLPHSVLPQSTLPQIALQQFTLPHLALPQSTLPQLALPQSTLPQLARSVRFHYRQNRVWN